MTGSALAKDRVQTSVQKLEIWKNPESTSKINFASIWRLDFDAIIPQSEKMVPTASSILRLKRTSFCVIGSGKLTQMTRSCQSGTVTCKLTPMSDTEVRTRCFKLERKPQETAFARNTAAPGILPHAGTFKRQPLFKEEDDKMIVIR